MNESEVNEKVLVIEYETLLEIQEDLDEYKLRSADWNLRESMEMHCIRRRPSFEDIFGYSICVEIDNDDTSRIYKVLKEK